jgi:IPT/TIG domain-containing protein
VPRKRAPRAGVPDDPMDWARSPSPSAPSEVPAGPRTSPAPRRAPAAAGRRSPLLPIAAVVVVLAAGAAGYYFWNASRVPQVTSVSPARARVGDILSLTGVNLGEAAGDVTVTIGGRPGKVLQAAGTLLKVEVPEVAMTSGRDTAAPVVVAVSGRESAPAAVAIFQAPRLKALLPEVGMPGDEVTVSGASLEPGIQVTFGGVPAEVVEASGASVRVKVPPISAAPGTEVPVEATLGADKSIAIPFVVGHVPLVTRLEQRNAAPGELVTVHGRGFDPTPDANRITVGGAPALVVSATPREIKAVVPRLPMGETSLKVMVPGSTNVGEAALAIDPSDDPIGFRFVAEPFVDTPGHDHAALATGLGPAFILSGGGGKRAAERAYEAQRQLNDAAQAFASSREADIRAQYEPSPSLILYGRSIVFLDVTEGDAAGYAEDWTRAGPRLGVVTPARLARWWEAVARDLVLLLARAEKPVHAAGLAAEGKALADLHDAARRTVARGVPAALAEGRTREALRLIALRVPAGVTAPTPASAARTATPATGTAAPTADAIAPLRLDGAWSGIEIEGGQRKSISLSFHGASGTLTYQRALAMSVPIVGAAQPQKGVMRFEVPTGGGRRYYRGQWDGVKVRGKLYLDAELRREAGTFEIDRSQ